MKKVLFILISFAGFIWANGQQNVGIGTTTPHASAILDLSSANKGLVLPNVSLTNINSSSPVASPAVGLLVWNTNAGITGGNGIGFYYWNGVKWEKLTSSLQGWSLTGNSGIDTALNFLGTKDSMPIIFKVNNEFAGKMDLSSNISLGKAAGIHHLQGARRNTVFGDSAGYLNSSGNNNTLVGAYAGKSAVLSSDNTFVGFRAGENTTISGNTFVGSGAGMHNTWGSGNTAIGQGASRANTESGFNTVVGANTGLHNLGSFNSYFGFQAGMGRHELSSGIKNTALGMYAGFNITAGSNNTFVGYSSGFINERGNKNVFVGDSAGFGNYNGSKNVIIGSMAGRFNSGSFNVFLGDSAGYSPSGSNSIAIGSKSTILNAGLTNATAIGARSQVNGSNSLVLGSIAGLNGATDNTNVGIGTPLPQQRLHISIDHPGNGGASQGVLIENVGAPSSGEATVSFKNSATGDSTWMIGLNQNRDLSFAIGTSFTGTSTKVTVLSSGEMGIGTTSPDATLDVDGTVKIGTNGSVLTSVIKSNEVINVSALSQGQSEFINTAVAGASTGATVHVSPTSDLPGGLVIASARVVSADTVRIKFTNAGLLGTPATALTLRVTIIQ